MKYTAKDLDIFFITKEIPDYLHDMIFLGLCRMGCNVHDFPRKPSLHGTPHPSKFHSGQLLLNILPMSIHKNPDIMVVPSLSHDYNPAGLSRWALDVCEYHRFYKPAKTVILDGMDHTKYIYPAIAATYHTIFKRELIKPYPGDTWYPINMASMPESFRFIPFSERVFDLCFIATTSNGMRARAYDYLISRTESLKLKMYLYLDKEPLPRDHYLDILSQSRVSLSVRGMGHDCYRYWEIPAKGVVLLSEQLPIDIANDYVDGEDCFKFKADDTFSDLGAVLEKIKGISSDQLEQMAIKGLARTMRYHTCDRRAEYFLDTIYR